MHGRWMAGVVLGLGWADRVLAQSCAMCASSFGPNDPVTKAFNWSIIFLMAAPYTLVAVVGGWLFVTYRRAARRRRAPLTELPWGRRRPVPSAGPEEV